MAATQKKQMWHWAGPPAEIETGLIAASQGIYIPGSPAYLSEAGTWKLADTSDGSDAWHGFFIDKITAEHSANDEIRIARISTDILYAVFCENNGTDSVVAQSDVGDQFGIVVSATASEVGYCSLDLNSTTNVLVNMRNIASNVRGAEYTTADSPGVAIVQFLDKPLEATKA